MRANIAACSFCPCSRPIFGAIKMVGAARFELATLWSQTRCATRLRYAPTRVRQRPVKAARRVIVYLGADVKTIKVVRAPDEKVETGFSYKSGAQQRI